LLLVGALSAETAAAVVQASVDRARVRLNESFTYTLRFEGEPDTEPDLAPIEDSFDILQRSQSTRIQGANGQYSQFTEWLVVLMPTQVGSFQIPAVSVGGQVSNPVTVQVIAAQDNEAPGDVFLEVNAEPQHPYVQAQTVLTVSLFLGIDTRGSRLSEPQVAGGEAIVEKLGDDRQFQVERDGRRFIVIERRYAVFPQEAGNLTIEPMRFETQVLDGRRFSRIQRFNSDAIELMVRGAVAPPTEYADATWLPARSLQLTERFAGDGSGLVAGIPVTRSVMLVADGVLSTQLPELALSTLEPIKQYADQPELENTVTADGMRASRTERYAVISTRAGEFELPGVAVPWFNVVEERWQAAQLARRTVAVSKDPDQPLFEEPEATLAERPPPADAGPWRLVSLGLAVGWAGSLVFMLGFKRRKGGGDNRREAAVARQRNQRRASRLLSQARRACRDNDPAAARDRLMAWGQLQFADDPPATLGALGRRLRTEIRAALVGLEAAFYGRSEQQSWQGHELLAALKTIDGVAASAAPASDQDALLPLYR
jgi:hypothetical protein